MGHFRPKIIMHPQSSGCTLKILHNESDQEAYEIYVSDFCKKDLVESEWGGPKYAVPSEP